MADQFHDRQSSLFTAIRPRRPSDLSYIHDGRACLVLVATAAVAVNAWALFPTTVAPGIPVPPREASIPSAAVTDAARDLGARPAPRLMGAKLVSVDTAPTGSGQLLIPAVTVTVVPLRSKIQALLLLLSSEAGETDLAALKAKLLALLKLPDPLLEQLMGHPDLANLNSMMDAVFLGTSDISTLGTELDKIDVVSSSGPTEHIDVVKVNGNAMYVVHSPVAPMAADADGGTQLSEMPQPPTEYRVESTVEVAAGVTATAFAPSGESLAPEPVDPTMSAFAVAPSVEPLAPAPEPVDQTPSAFAVAPGAEPPTPETSVMTTGNKFEPGETVTGTTDNNSSAVPSVATIADEVPGELDSAVPSEGSTSPTAGEGDSGPSGESDSTGESKP